MNNKMESIIRRNNTNYTTVDNEFIYNSELSSKLVGILLRLLSLPEDWKFNKEGIYSMFPERKASMIFDIVIPYQKRLHKMQA